MTAADIRKLAQRCGFELAGVARAQPVPESAWYQEWAAAGFAGEMRYLTDRRAAVRNDPRLLLPSARSIICVGKLYNSPWPYSTQFQEADRVWISRYAWGDDYHEVLRCGLARLDSLLPPHESKICVDTAPLLERSYARQAGLGWIGKNTCLINQQSGSWFFLGELLVSLAIEPDRSAPPDRCGTCTRCIDACPTGAIVPAPLGHTVDSRACISYFTIELHGSIPREHRERVGAHVFGCDICQDVCPWNRRAPAADCLEWQPRHFAPHLDRMASLTEDQFSAMFHGTPVTRARYAGFLRNVAVAMGNARQERYRAVLQKLTQFHDSTVAEHARWALDQLP